MFTTMIPCQIDQKCIFMQCVMLEGFQKGRDTENSHLHHSLLCFTYIFLKKTNFSQAEILILQIVFLVIWFGMIKVYWLQYAVLETAFANPPSNVIFFLFHNGLQHIIVATLLKSQDLPSFTLIGIPIDPLNNSNPGISPH